MAPGLTEETPLPINGAKGTNGENGKHAITEEFQDGAAPAKKGKYNAIPGPLGLASASLEGKVALVTGAGELDFPVDPDFWVLFFWSIRCSPLDVAPAIARILPSHQFGPREPGPCKPRARTVGGGVRPAPECPALGPAQRVGISRSLAPAVPWQKIVTDQRHEENKLT